MNPSPFRTTTVAAAAAVMAAKAAEVVTSAAAEVAVVVSWGTSEPRYQAPAHVPMKYRKKSPAARDSALATSIPGAAAPHSTWRARRVLCCTAPDAASNNAVVGWAGRCV